jgi:hypothetical protein
MRTKIGIVEWARRARGARAVELRLAHALGTAIAQKPTGGQKIALARAARSHGRHAELWESVVPVLHELDAELDAVDDLDGVRSVTQDDDPQVAIEHATADLAVCYRAWLAGATPIADAPVIAVLRLVLAPDPAAE